MYSMYTSHREQAHRRSVTAVEAIQSYIFDDDKRQEIQFGSRPADEWSVCSSVKSSRNE